MVNIFIKIIDFLMIIPVSAVCGLYLAFSFMINKTHTKDRSKRNLALLVMGADIDEIFKKYGSYEIFYEHAIGNYFDAVFLWSYPAGSTKKKKINNTILFIQQRPIFTYLNYTGMIIFSCRIIHHAIKNTISIIRSTSPCSHGIIAVLCGKLFKIPSCISIHADYDKRYAVAGSHEAPTIFGYRGIACVFERWAMKNTDMVMPIRESLITYVRNSGAQRIRVIPHGINMNELNNLNSIRPAHLPRDKKIISSVGRISKDNYSDDMAEIAEQITHKRNDVYCCIIGDGREYVRIKQQVELCVTRDRIYMPGFVDHDSAFQYRMFSDINLSLMGGFSLIEACAAGKPVIAYDVEWHYELIKNNETGMLIKENNIQGVIEAIVYLLENPEEAERLGENARQNVFKKHDISITNKIKIDCYAELLRNNQNT